MAGEASVVAEREAMAAMTASALTELQEIGIEFNEVDRAPFLARVREVNTSNADRVGGMRVIEEVSAQ